MLKRIFATLCLGIFTLVYSMFTYADTSFVSRPEVQSFIEKMVVKHGFDREELNDLFSTVRIRHKVMQSIRAPLEQETWATYQGVFITESRIRQGVAFWAKNRETLARAEKIYGVPASIIVATIGVETKYGKNKGEYPVIEALTNIAFSGSPRSNYFRQELEEFLLLSREQHLNPLTVKGSYAGAIGQPQFMPSSYRYYAVNFSGNSKIDLSNNAEDIIGSIANYYKKHGWENNQPVVIPTLVDKTHSRSMPEFGKKTLLSTDQLANYGIYPYTPYPTHKPVKLIQLKGYHGNEYWIGLHNFEVIKRYNPSDLYAMAVYQLSYYITALKERSNHV